MPTLSPNLRGIALMIAATASFIINDTLLKLITADIPPFETLFIRGFLTMLWGIPLLAMTRNLQHLPKVFALPVMSRNAFELVAVLGYILALAHAPIADVTALSQLAPMLLTLGAVWFFGAKIGRGEVGLIAVAFVGAVMVAQPGGSGFSFFALFGLWNAAASAGRDLLGRRVAADVPGLVVAFGAGLVVMVGAGIAMLLTEHPVLPDVPHILLLVVIALFLTGGHLFIFLSYRVGAVGAVAPFFYAGTIWALISGVVAFHALPNALALAGIAVILISGVIVVWIDARRSKLIASMGPE